jgi:hypothetical protein
LIFKLRLNFINLKATEINEKCKDSF